MANSIVISGSYRKHFDRIQECRAQFIQFGVEVLRPAADKVLVDGGPIVRLEGDPETIKGIEEAQLAAISAAELLYVVNPGGYLGPATTLEMGYAYRSGLPIVTSERPYDEALSLVVSSVGSPKLALELLTDNGN